MIETSKMSLVFFLFLTRNDDSFPTFSVMRLHAPTRSQALGYILDGTKKTKKISKSSVMIKAPNHNTSMQREDKEHVSK